MTTLTKTEQLNALRDRIHAGNRMWWSDIHTGEPIKRDRRELLALVVSEIVEALEGERKNLKDDKLVHRPMAEVEMADSWIRLADLAGGFNITLKADRYYGMVHPVKPVALFHLMKLAVRCEVEDYIISTCLSYIEAYCEKFGYDLHGAIEEKLTFNKSRLDHSREARLAENGKRF